jgi:methylthioribulose-1-phosphate dehydratase
MTRHVSSRATGARRRLVREIRCRSGRPALGLQDDCPSTAIGAQSVIVAPDSADIAEQLAEIGRRFDARDWVLGTSGNFSVVLGRDPLRLLMTRSGIAKGTLTADGTVEVDAEGSALRPGAGRPSSEALLHIEIAAARAAGAVLHTHSIWSTVLSDRHTPAGGLAITGYEMLKGLAGVSTHEHHEWIPILENDQDMSRLAGRVRRMLTEQTACHAFLLRRHGLYTWGDTLPDAVRHVEILEFLLEAVGRTDR